MLVKLLHSMAGENFSYGKGSVIEVSDDVGISWVKMGVAIVFATSKQTHKTEYEKREIPEPMPIDELKKIDNELQAKNKTKRRSNKSNRSKGTSTRKRKQ